MVGAGKYSPAARSCSILRSLLLPFLPEATWWLQVSAHRLGSEGPTLPSSPLTPSPALSCSLGPGVPASCLPAQAPWPPPSRDASWAPKGDLGWGLVTYLHYGEMGGWLWPQPACSPLCKACSLTASTGHQAGVPTQGVGWEVCSPHTPSFGASLDPSERQGHPESCPGQEVRQPSGLQPGLSAFQASRESGGPTSSQLPCQKPGSCPWLLGLPDSSLQKL